MAEIPYLEKLEIKMMAEQLLEINPIIFGWARKFITKDYLSTHKCCLCCGIRIDTEGCCTNCEELYAGVAPAP